MSFIARVSKQFHRRIKSSAGRRGRKDQGTTQGAEQTTNAVDRLVVVVLQSPELRTKHQRQQERTQVQEPQ